LISLRRSKFRHFPHRQFLNGTLFEVRCILITFLFCRDGSPKSWLRLGYPKITNGYPSGENPDPAAAIPLIPGRNKFGIEMSGFSFLEMVKGDEMVKEVKKGRVGSKGIFL